MNIKFAFSHFFWHENYFFPHYFTITVGIDGCKKLLSRSQNEPLVPDLRKNLWVVDQDFEALEKS